MAENLEKNLGLEKDQQKEAIPLETKTVEKVPQKEQGFEAPESSVENQGKKLGHENDTEGKQGEKATTRGTVPRSGNKSPTLQKIEDILSEGLVDQYKALSPSKRKQFKEKGEEVSRKIEAMLNQAKIKAKEVLELIFDWLKILPGMNRFFLESEARVRAKKIMEMHEDRKRNNPMN